MKIRLPLIAGDSVRGAEVELKATDDLLDPATNLVAVLGAPGNPRAETFGSQLASALSSAGTTCAVAVGLEAPAVYRCAVVVAITTPTVPLHRDPVLRRFADRVHLELRRPTETSARALAEQIAASL